MPQNTLIQKLIALPFTLFVYAIFGALIGSLIVAAVLYRAAMWIAGKPIN